MKGGLFQNLRLMITAWGFGIILTGTIATWRLTPISTRIFFLSASVFAFVYSLLFAVLFHDEYADHEQNNTNTHPNKVA